jgi:hypothetical protein
LLKKIPHNPYFYYTSLFLFPFSLDGFAIQQKENLLCSLEHIGMLAQLKLSQNKKLSGLRQQKENLMCSSEHIGMLAQLKLSQNKKEECKNRGLYV